MKALNIVTLSLIIIGGLNWGLVALFDWDMVAGLFGAGSIPTGLVYILVGLSAIWQLMPLVKALRTDEPAALRGSSIR